MTSPIVLFCYNRLSHLQEVINSIQKNSLAEESELYIFSDSFKHEEEKDTVLAVRKYLKTITGFKSIHIIEAQSNKGLAQSIISGVSEIVNKYGKVIVLEDDCVVSPYFLDYMNTALDKYQNDDTVMHINGYIPNINSAKIHDTFFISQMCCWGWGTWKRSWDCFEKKPKKLFSLFDKKMKKRFNFNGQYDLFSQISQNDKGKIDTWAVFWAATIFLKKGLCLTPKIPLVQNIGTDSSGTHFSFSTQKYVVDLHQEPITSFPEKFEESEDAYHALVAFYKSIKLTFWGHIKSKTKKLFSYFVAIVRH
tara:strand:- start:6554 stop:7474 length:921 start_codon:yes stop_codon:yes gene_type:complete